MTQAFDSSGNGEEPRIPEAGKGTVNRSMANRSGRGRSAARQIALLALLLAWGQRVWPAEHFAAPNGGPSGDGSRDRPWDLQTALDHPSSVKPGDSIWLRGGRYDGFYKSMLQGTPNNRISVRGSPGERVTLSPSSEKSGYILEIRDGGWTDYRDFEITSSQKTRELRRTPRGTFAKHPQLGIQTSQTKRKDGLRFINLIVHDVSGQGVGFWSDAVDSEMYGCIVYYNGSQRFDHGIYTQNRWGSKRIEDNIIFGNLGCGINAYGSSKAFLENFHLEGNVVFNHVKENWTSGSNILLGGGRVTRNPVIRNNYTYRGQTRVGYGVGKPVGAVIEGNWLVRNPYSSALLRIDLLDSASQLASFRDNVVLGGPLVGFDPGQFANNQYLTTPPGGVEVIIRENKYEAGRAHIIVYNWDKQSTVTATVPNAVLKAGDHFEVRDAQDYFGEPVRSGIYDGQGLRLPMTGLSMAKPVGDFPALERFEHSGPEFGVFVLQRTRAKGPGR